MQSLVDRCLCVEGEASIDLSRHLSGNDLQDLGAELNEQIVQRSVDLLVQVLPVALAVRNRLVDERGILGLLGRGEDQGRVRCGILRLVFIDGSEVARVADDDLE